MHFVAIYKDKPGGEAARQTHRPEHVAYRMALGPKLIMAGALLGPDGKATVGSMIVFEAEDQAAAQAFAAGDPFVREGALVVDAVYGHRIVAFNAPEKAKPAH